jgi:hypothetical protein
MRPNVSIRPAVGLERRLADCEGAKGESLDINVYRGYTAPRTVGGDSAIWPRAQSLRS